MGINHIVCTFNQENKPKQTVKMVKAVSVLRGDSKVAGTVTFEQADENSPTTITWDITGNDANAKRGFHIHTYGDNTHGAPSDEARHVGDLGNIDTDGQGNAKGSVTDKLIKVIGPHSIVGRTVVVHAGTDDLGKGDNEESLKTGNPVPVLPVASLVSLLKLS